MQNYILYLTYLEGKLAKYFESQKPYICCKQGCSKCCERGDFPYKQMEVEYLLYGFDQLPIETKQIILEKVQRLKMEKEKSGTENFVYECPFLINKECSVYNYRGVICRSFGLVTTRENKKPKVPFCAFDGLNYANVLDKETNTISEEKFLELNIDIEPLAYDAGYISLTGEKYENAFNFKFGELRPLIDWFK